MKVKSTYGFLCLFVTLAAVPCSASESESTEAVVRNMVQALNDRDLDALDDLIAADVRRHCAATPGLVVENLDQFKEFLRQDFAAVPDSHQEIDFLFTDGRHVAARVLYRGTQTGPWGPFPPSGKQFELPFIAILRVEDGKIAEIWVEWDNLAALQQLGHLPPPDSGSARDPGNGLGETEP